MPVRRLLTLLLLVVSLLALPVPASAGPKTDAELTRITNADRQKLKLPRLASSPTLARLARAHSLEMGRRAARHHGRRCDRRALWHNDIRRAAGRWRWLGQNVGCITVGRGGMPQAVRALQNAFLRSPGHRANIVSGRANAFGVGTCIRHGVIWVTVNFKQG